MKVSIETISYLVSLILGCTYGFVAVKFAKTMEMLFLLLIFIWIVVFIISSLLNLIGEIPFITSMLSNLYGHTSTGVILFSCFKKFKE